MARSRGVPAHLINDLGELDPQWLEGVETVAITSGASAPERLVLETVAFFREAGAKVKEVGFLEENIHFALPAETTVF